MPDSLSRIICGILLTIGSLKLQEEKNKRVKSKEIKDFPTRCVFFSNNKIGLAEKFFLIILFILYRNVRLHRHKQNKQVD